jgi:hypothetical protein
MMTTWVCCECKTRQVSFKEVQPSRCIQCGLGPAYLRAVEQRVKEIAKR